MREKYIEIVNNLTNYYKKSVSVFTKEDNGKVITITLADYGIIRVNLSKISEEKMYYESENYEAIENGPVQINKLDDKYIVATIGENDKASVVFTYKCDDIDLQLDLYNYSDIKIKKKYIKGDYRIKLGNHIAHNLLMKHATLGDVFLSEREKYILPMAMWIAILDSSQSFVDGHDYHKIFDLFIQYDGKYEKEEFLTKAIQIENDYENIKDVKKVCDIMKNCLNKLQISKDRSIYSEMEKKLIDYLCYWNTLEPVYEVYTDFTCYMKDTCENFESNNSTNDKDLEDYIKNKAGKKLVEAGFIEEYPYYRIKTEDKVYVVKFEIINNKKVNLKMLQEMLEEGSEFMELLDKIDYKYLKIEDVNRYEEEICKNKEEIDDEIETILECLLVDKALSKQNSKLGIIGGIIAAAIVYLLWKQSILICGVIGIVICIVIVNIEKYARMFAAIYNEGENEDENE